MPRRLLPKSPIPTPRVKLRMARERARWSQFELGERLETSQVTVSRWETGETAPSPYFRKRLSHLFGCTPDDLDLDAGSPSHEEKTIVDPMISPPPRFPLVGREQELASLRAHLCHDQEGVTAAISGLPGVGKTTLAYALAHDPMIHQCFPDGVLWAGLGVHPDLSHHLLRWATLLGLPATEIRSLRVGSRETELALAVRSAIGARRMLLILDDAWTVEEARTFYVGGAQCATLITTRFTHIAASLSANSLILRELTTQQSFELLTQLAPQIVAHEAPKVQELVQAVGGLPLALTLIGNYLRSQGLSGQARRIQMAFDRLQVLETRLQLSEQRTPLDHYPSLPEKQPLSLQTVIAVSDQQLPAPTRAALYALSVLPAKPESFSEEVALAVAACSLEALDALLDAGLLEAVGNERYTMHQTIADYARLYLDHPQPQERFIAYALTFLEQYRFDYEMLAQERSLLLQALEVAAALDKQPELVRGVCAFIPYLLRHGNYAQAHQYLLRAQQAAQALQDHIGTMHILRYLGELAGKQGNYAQSQLMLQEGLLLARDQDDSEHRCALLSLLGRAHWKQGNYAHAETSLQEGLQLARQMGYTRHLCELLDLLGAVAERIGDYAQAEAYFQEGLRLAREIGDKGEICRLASGLGIIFGLRGERVAAVALLQEGLRVAQQIGYHEWACVAFSNLGEITRVLLRDYVQAEAFLLEGLTLARKMEQREWIGAMLINLTELEIDRENYQQARVYLEEGTTEAATLGLPRVTICLLFWRSVLLLLEERIDEAEAVLRDMQQVLPPNDMELQAYVHYGQARLAAKKGHLSQAYLLGETSAVALERAGHYLSHEVRHWLETLPPMSGRN